MQARAVLFLVGVEIYFGLDVAVDLDKGEFAEVASYYEVLHTMTLVQFLCSYLHPLRCLCS